MISQRDRGDLARFYTVTDPRKHQRGFTIYKVTARIVSRKNPEDVQEIVVWKRYSDFKKLHRDLWQIHKNLFRQQELFPPFAKAKLFGRFDECVIEERRQCAEDLLQFSANIPALYNSSQLEDFFKGGEVHDGSDLIGPAEPLTDYTDSLSDCSSDVRKDSCGLDDLTFTSISECGGLSSDSDHVSLSVDVDSLCGIDDGMASNQTSPSKFLEVLPSPELSVQSVFASSHEGVRTDTERESRSSFPARLKQKLSKPDYLSKAGSLITLAMKKETEQDYRSAIEFYRKGVDLLLEGVQGEPNPTRREAVKKKTAEYLMRAESLSSLYLKHLPQDTSAPPGALSSRPSWNLRSPAEELKAFRVLGVIDKVLLVLDTRTQETCILKSLRKSELCATRTTIIPCRVPNMVCLREYIVSEESVFLVLQHAEGGKLWAYLSKYLNRSTEGSFDAHFAKSSQSEEDLLKCLAPCAKNSIDSRESNEHNMLTVQPLQSSFTISSQDDSSNQEDDGRESPLKWVDSASGSEEECTTSYLTLCKEYGQEKIESDTLSEDPLLRLDGHEASQKDFVDLQKPLSNDNIGLNAELTCEELMLFSEEPALEWIKSTTMADHLRKSRDSPMEFFRIDSRESTSDFLVNDFGNEEHDLKSTVEELFCPFQGEPETDKALTGQEMLRAHDTVSRGSGDSVPVISFKDAVLDDGSSTEEGRPDLLVNLPGTEQVDENEATLKNNLKEIDSLENKLFETPDVLPVNNSIEPSTRQKEKPLVTSGDCLGHSQNVVQNQVMFNSNKEYSAQDFSMLEPSSTLGNLETLLPESLGLSHSTATGDTCQLPYNDPSDVKDLQDLRESLQLDCSKVHAGSPSKLMQFQVQIEDTDANYYAKKELQEETEIHKIFQELDAKLSEASHVFIPETCIQRWAAEIVVSLDALHREGIVCRDLNPNNILLNDRGHIQLTYFSRWTEVEESCDSDAIEKMYCAPEVGGITGETQACDWWSLGALLFELFTRKALVECHPAGITTHTVLHMPDYVSKEARSLIQQLLQFNPMERLGAGVAGVEGIKSHPFFAGVDWEELAR
ncbi:hypothetical protein GDO86_009068 [Hymenochirus boettgeri]|uniref:Ribosomal protein S6 kinase delta-1 n=1 Tax=Hymenochirus boettgeri TaxID=247094 RepID=A0A8T2JF18_9PIPI|nr:hypothetical protein GDO86_009068 [Hymenochirus boettgeri]